ncbi:MAG: hypothetical protein FJ096_05840 [Deltaproteobacteria bacterium]|nr:hypothetical protein [Deltaproteobacteria bacterium]
MKVRGADLEVEVADASAAAAREPDLSSVPGARLLLSAAWERAGTRSDAACVAVPLPTWLPGLETALLDGASSRARVAAGLDALTPGPVERLGDRISQGFEGRASDVVARGRHVLGFRSGGRELVACTVVCTERRSASSSARCEVDEPQVRVLAAFEAEPSPGLIVRLLLGAAERPRLALGAVGVGLVLVAALLVWRRPRPGRERLT